MSTFAIPLRNGYVVRDEERRFRRGESSLK